MNNIIIKQIRINKKTEELIKKGMEVFKLPVTDFYTIKDLIGYCNCEDEDLTIILLLLFLSFKNGSLCIKLKSNEIVEDIKRLERESHEVINNFKKNLQKYSNLISTNTKEFKPLIYMEKWDSSLYFHKHFIGEQKLKENIHRLMEVETDFPNTQKQRHTIEEINKFTPPLNDKQKIAVFLAIIKNFLVISGGPGTGKSSIIKAIVEVLLKIGYSPNRIKVSAPTGRASNRLAEVLEKNSKTETQLENVECLTIHRLLEYSLRRGIFRRNRENLLQVDVVIVDEVSMVDVNLMSSLFDALPEHAKVIFLGDKDQLPSVNVGAVLSDIIPTEFEEEFSDILEPLKIPNIKLSTKKQKNVDRVVILEKSYRTQGESLEIAKAINDSRLPMDFDKFKITQVQFNNKIAQKKETGSFLFVNYSKINKKEFIFNIKSWSSQYIMTNDYINLIQKIKNITFQENSLPKKDQDTILEFLRIAKDSKILSPVKNGIYGVIYINTILKEHLAQKLRIGTIKNDYYFEGVPIVISENNYELNLFNGDIGIILKDKNGSLKVVFERGNNNYIFYSLNILPKFEIGFAITVHKSQGSEYNNILFVLPDKEDIPLLTREIIYTGITRSKKSCIIYGNLDVFKKIIKKKISRQSNLNFWK